MMPEWWLTSTGQVAQNHPDYSINLCNFQSFCFSILYQLSFLSIKRKSLNLSFAANPNINNTLLPIYK